MCNRQTEMVTYTLLPQKIYRMMSHSHQARLWIMVLAVCSVTPLIHAADNILHCHNLEYAGPIKEVIEMNPLSWQRRLPMQPRSYRVLPPTWPPLP